MCDVCGDAQHEPEVSRRDFLRTGALAALVPWSIGVARAADRPAPGAPPLPNAIAPADALKRLMDGNARYAANTPERARLLIGPRRPRAGTVSDSPRS